MRKISWSHGGHWCWMQIFISYYEPCNTNRKTEVNKLTTWSYTCSLFIFHHETMRFFSWWWRVGEWIILNFHDETTRFFSWWVGTDIFLSTNWLLDLTHVPNLLSPRDHEIFLMVGDGWFWIFTMRPRDISCGGVVGYGWIILNFHHKTMRIFSRWGGGGMDDCKFPPRDHETFLAVGGGW